MKQSKLILILTGLILWGAPLFGLTGNSQERAAQAAVDPTYPVTPGDTYQIDYSLRGESQRVQLIVDNTYKASIPGFGAFDTKGMTYYQLKAKVERLISDVLPGSVPVLTIRNPGVFDVLVKGEVKSSIEVPAWSFERLSSIVDKVKTKYTSFREIEIESIDGKKRQVDLFLALRTGALDQNPYLSYGDTIILKPYERQVVLEGELKRPGVYQLKKGENLTALINTLGDGFTPIADTSSIQVNRYNNGQNNQGKTFYINFKESQENLPLKDLDKITVNTRKDFLPVVYLQGAIGKTQEGTSVSSKIPVNITQGEKLSSVLRKAQDQFTKVSDLEHISIVKNSTGESLEVNGEELLLTGKSEFDMVLDDRDIIVVPFTQYYVYVSGEVKRPGRFPYIVNKSAEYYINLAGGFDTDTHLGLGVKIYDVYGKKHSQKDRILQPEDVIYAPKNHPIYWIGKYGADLAVITTSVTSLIILANYVGNLAKDDYKPIPTP